MKKTTIELEDELYRQAKIRAAERGITLRELVQNALRTELAIEEPPAKVHHVKFPLLDPIEGAPIITSEQVYQALRDMEDEEDAHYASFM